MTMIKRRIEKIAPDKISRHNLFPLPFLSPPLSLPPFSFVRSFASATRSQLISRVTRGMREREERRGYDRARQRDALIFARHYLNGTGITSTFTAVTILPAILVVTITADASVSMYGGDCAQFIPKLLATDIRKAVTATMVLYPLIYGLFPRVVRIIMSRRQRLTTSTPHNRNA